MPIAETAQRFAAVVRPRTEMPSRMIAPAPRKPIPVTICAATRVGSTFEPKSWKPYAPAIVKRHEPIATSMCVRMPASRSRSSRSMPIAAPSATRGDMGAADRGAARPAVGLEDVAVEVDGALAERLEVDDGANGSPDQALDLDGAAALLPARRLPLGALARRRRQQRALRREPT